MRKMALTVAAIALATTFGGVANASIDIGSVTPGTSPYSGPPPTYDFDSSTPLYVGGGIETGSSSDWAQPYGSTGNYYSVGPSTTPTGYIDLTGFGDIFNLSLLWGSVDDYNTLYFYDALFNPLASFGGTAIFDPANGDRTDPNTNPVVTFLLSGTDASNFSYLGFSSGTNAFEVDDITVNSGVPEPATWLMMLLGFGAVGFSVRRRKMLPKLAQLA